MNLRFIALLILVASSMSHASEDKLSALHALEQKKAITISDGVSYYTFKADGNFASGPIGMSGRTISGTWKVDTGRPNAPFVVEGKWSWVNGISRNDDYRRMVVSIWPGSFRPAIGAEKDGFLSAKEMFDCYFVIDELTAIKK